MIVDESTVDCMDPEAHPVAEGYPMLPEKELQELAEDIQERGLMQPIALLDGKILDGRNRLKACRMAGVEPTFITLPEDTMPADYAWGANGLRRHMSSVTRAKIAAERWIEHREANIQTRTRNLKQRASTNGSSAVDTKPSGVDEQSPPERVTLERVARDVGVSKPTVMKAAREMGVLCARTPEDDRRSEVRATIMTLHRAIDAAMALTTADVLVYFTLDDLVKLRKQSAIYAAWIVKLAPGQASNGVQQRCACKGCMAGKKCLLR